MARNMTATEYRAIERRHALATETVTRFGFTAEPGVSYFIVGFVGKPSAFDADTGFATHYADVAFRAVEFRREPAATGLKTPRPL